MMPPDLRPHQHAALRALLVNGPLPASRLARLVGHTPNEAAEFARRLAARGFVTLAGGSWGHSAIVSLVRRGSRVVAVALPAVFLFLPATAWPHDFFTGLRSPQGMPCCSGEADHGDCHVTKMCVLPDGKEGIISSIWGCLPIDWTKVLATPSPTGEPAICEPPGVSPTTTPITYCVLLGAAA